MSYIGSAFTEEMVTASIGLLASGLLAWVITLVRSRLPNTRLWRLDEPSSAVVVVSTGHVPSVTDTYTRPTTGIGQLRALAVVSRSLLRAYGQRMDPQAVCLSSDAVGRLVEYDIVVLGGPVTNAVTRELLRRRLDLPFTVEDHAFVWRAGGTGDNFESYIDGARCGEDFGIIVRMTNPFNVRRKAILLMGSHTYGTIAAARYFVEEMSKPRYWFYNDFTALVRSRVIDGHVTAPELQRILRMPAYQAPTRLAAAAHREVEAHQRIAGQPVDQQTTP